MTWHAVICYRATAFSTITSTITSMNICFFHILTIWRCLLLVPHGASGCASRGETGATQGRTCRGPERSSSSSEASFWRRAGARAKGSGFPLLR